MTAFDEDAWWGSCVNSFHEEQKQLVYAPRMGLVPTWDCAHPPTFDMQGRSVLDIGGGPCSLLLKCINLGPALIVDPGQYPQWTADRYEAHGIQVIQERAEDISSVDGYDRFDEAWSYNCLQHVDDPKLVVANARAAAKTIRVFEWIGIEPYDGHPQRLERAWLEHWLGSPGYVAELNQDGAVGTAFYGVFNGESAAGAATLTA